jgi:hypothetical protein
VVEIVNAVCERESKAARRVTFAMMISQIACFGDEFVDGFYRRHVRRIISAFSIRVIRVLTIDNVDASAYYIDARYS